MRILITGASPSPSTGTGTGTGRTLGCHLARDRAQLALCASPADLQALAEDCGFVDVAAKA